jgi:hypothetical protein
LGFQEYRNARELLSIEQLPAHGVAGSAAMPLTKDKKGGETFSPPLVLRRSKLRIQDSKFKIQDSTF